MAEFIFLGGSMSTSDEDSYSMIFTSLKHPIRRRILRILSNERQSFSDLQKQFKIESSHLTYHIDGLGNLLYKTDDGKYALSSLGDAAVSMMKNVEEPPRTSMHIGSKSIGRMSALKLLSLILVCGLVASLIFNGIILFKYNDLRSTNNELNELYSDLTKLHNQLNQSYGELNRTYNELNQTYFSHMPHALTFQTVQIYDVSVNQGYYVLRNDSDLMEMHDELASERSSGNISAIETWLRPDVNFSESTAIVVFMGRHLSTGYNIEIKEIIDTGQFLVVKVEKTYPGSGCVTALEDTYPCHMVEISKTDKPIIFDTIERTTDCS